MKYEQYRDFLNKSSDLPFSPRGKKFTLQDVGSWIISLIISVIVIGICVPGTTLFGFHKIIWMIGLAVALSVATTLFKTANIPFYSFIAMLAQFVYKKVTKNVYKVGFVQVSKPKPRIKINWKVPYRDILDTGDELHYYMYPLKGTVRQIRGLALKLSAATQIRYNPISQLIKVKNGNFEKLVAQNKSVSSLLPQKFDVGAGITRFLYQKGKVRAIYQPDERRGR